MTAGVPTSIPPFSCLTVIQIAFCTHNIAYQGRFAAEDYSQLNLPDEFRANFTFVDGYAKPVKGPKINWLKAGFLGADKVVTVSPNYALELQSGPDKGVELDDVIRETGVVGIVNGMDTTEWDPSEDKYLDTPYNIETVSWKDEWLKKLVPEFKMPSVQLSYC